MAVATVARRAIDGVHRGHPWIYRESVAHVSSRASSSGLPIVLITSEHGDRIGCGVYDPASAIAIRVWSIGPAARLDASVFEDRLARAARFRSSLFPPGSPAGDTTAYRLLHGEGDRTPGIVIDRYGEVAVLRLDGEGAGAALPLLAPRLEEQLREMGVTTLYEKESRGDHKGLVCRFGPERSRLEVREHGIPFVVDVARGQKTGAFLDQRDNRRRVGELVRRRARSGLGTRVLNLFSYTGGFSLHAALAGATVTSVDVAAHAHATAQESMKLAGVDPRAHAFVAADAFAWLESQKRGGGRFDVVVSDPPSFAPSERAKPKALSAYRALHRACADVLAPHGTLVAASCSSHVTAEDFLATLDDAALGRSDLSLRALHGPPPDHPTLPAFPEGRYLKCAILE